MSAFAGTGFQYHGACHPDQAALRIGWCTVCGTPLTLQEAPELSPQHVVLPTFVKCVQLHSLEGPNLASAAARWERRNGSSDGIVANVQTTLYAAHKGRIKVSTAAVGGACIAGATAVSAGS